MREDDLSNFARCIAQGEETPEGLMAGMAYDLNTGIEIYRNNYFGNLKDALSSAYPVVEQIVGEEFFRHISREYMKSHPSRSGNLNGYGEGMAEFLKAFEPAHSLAYLPDVAKLEWACHCAYYAEDANALDLAGLAQIPQERYADLILQVHPACHLVQSDYPVASIWHAHQPGGSFVIAGSECFALISRAGGKVLVSGLSKAEAGFFAMLKKGRTLLDAANEMPANEDGFDLQRILLKLLELNALSGFELKAAPYF